MPTFSNSAVGTNQIRIEATDTKMPLPVLTRSGCFPVRRVVKIQSKFSRFHCSPPPYNPCKLQRVVHHSHQAVNSLFHLPVSRSKHCLFSQHPTLHLFRLFRSPPLNSLPVQRRTTRPFYALDRSNPRKTINIQSNCNCINVVKQPHLSIFTIWVQQPAPAGVKR
jgi:hypothetical protein